MLKWECKTVSRSAPPENRRATMMVALFIVFFSWSLAFGEWFLNSGLRLSLSLHVSRSIIITGRKNRPSSRKYTAFGDHVIGHLFSPGVIEAVKTFYKDRLICDSSQGLPDLIYRRFRLKTCVGVKSLIDLSLTANESSKIEAQGWKI